ARGLLRQRGIGVQAERFHRLVDGADLPAQQGVRVFQVGGGDQAADRRVAAVDDAAAAAAAGARGVADRGGPVLGGVAVGAQAGGEQELLAELQGVEHVQRGRVGAAVRDRAAARPRVVAGGVPVRVVQAGGRAAAGGGGAVGGLLLAGQLHAGAEEVVDRAGGEVGAQVQLVGQDPVLLVLEGRVAARQRVGGEIVRVGPLDVAGHRVVRVAAGAHERGQQ